MADKTTSFNSTAIRYYMRDSSPNQWQNFRIHVVVTEPENSVDIANNTSKVKCTVTADVWGDISGAVSTFGRTVSRVAVTINGTEKVLLSSGTWCTNGYNFGTTEEVTITHDDATGEKSIPVSCSLVISGTTATGSTTFALTKIPRGTVPVLSPDMIDKPTQNLSITATRKYNTYKHTIKWCVIPNGSIDSPDPPANQWTTLVTEGTTESFTVTYNDLKAKLDAAGAYVGIIRVNAVTYDANGNIVGSATGNYANSKIKTGMVPLSLYDDLGGGVGVTLTGSPSGREGIFVDDKGPFEITQVTLNIGGQSKTGYILFCEG